VFKSFPAAPFYGNTLTHWAMSAPTFMPSRHEVWYSDGMYGFYAVRLTNDVWSPADGADVTAATNAAPAPAAAGPELPRTGWTEPLLLVAALLALALGASRLTAATRR
jgi:hypothetical protein